VSGLDEVNTPTTDVTAFAAQQQLGTIARSGSNSHIAWDRDMILWDAHGNLDPRGPLATDRPHVVKLYGAYSFPFGTQLGLNFYGGSGTPITTYVNSNLLSYPMVNGRGDMGRTPILTRTDLLLSHELTMQGRKRVRLELNVINLFNEKDDHSPVQLPQQGSTGRKPDGSCRCHRSVESQLGSRLRLQCSDSRHSRWRQRLRSALRPG
jgi:hypothetical protein